MDVPAQRPSAGHDLIIFTFGAARETSFRPALLQRRQNHGRAGGCMPTSSKASWWLDETSARR